jgi:hypothetical protein
MDFLTVLKPRDRSSVGSRFSGGKWGNRHIFRATAKYILIQRAYKPPENPAFRSRIRGAGRGLPSVLPDTVFVSI